MDPPRNGEDLAPEHRIGDEGIGPPLVREIARLAMAGDEHRVVAQRPELAGDRVDQILMIALREVGAADRSLEQHVADDGELRRRMVEDDMAGRVAGAVIDVEHQLADGHGIAVDQPAARFERHPAHAILATVLGEPVDPEPIGLVRSLDPDAELGGELAREAAMVDMAMGDQDLLDRDFVLLRRRAQPVEIAAGIDEGAAHRLRAPEQAAILLERRDRHDRHAHRGIGHGRQIEGVADGGNMGLPQRAAGGMRIAMALPSAPFVLLDDARPGGAPARLYADPVEIVRADTPEQVLPALETLRAARGRGLDAAGYLRYEAAAALEPKLADLAAPGPLLWFGLFAGHRTVATEDLLPDPAGAWAGKPQPTITRQAYAERFARVAELIAAGDIYQANLTFRAAVATAGSPGALYALLRGRAAAGYGALVATGAEWLLSFSPELFFALEGGTLSARPMKGTAVRDSDPAQDAAHAEALRTDPKQRAENLMIVDLLRNDLSRVARAGSVAVPQLFHVEHYPTVHQMVSEIRAEIAADKDAVDALAALFPCGSITGAPKLRAMAIIADTEEAPRGIYTGAIGRLDANGDAKFNVAIRTLSLAGGDSTALLGLGSGVVADSDPELEWQECLAKGAFVTAGERVFDLIETMRFDPLDGIPLLERHLTRMKTSAETFGFAFDRHSVRNELQAATFRLRVASKVRLLLGPSGAIAIGISPLPEPPEQPVQVALQLRKVAPDDFRLAHKTSRRGFYDRARAASGAWEILFTDAEGFLTEGSFTNIFVARDGMLLTPPRTRGLLPGVLRAELIAQGRAVEQDLRPADLADGFMLGNALRGLVSAVTVAERAEGAL